MDSSDSKFSFDIVDQPSGAAPSREIEEVHEEEGWIIVSSDENDASQRASVSRNQRRKIDSEFHEYQALRNQSQDSMTEVHDDP